MRRPGILPVLLAGTAVATRLPALWHPLTQDEVFSARVVTSPTLAAALHRIVRTESTPPLWYLLAWAGRRLGAPIVDLRLLSVLFGALLALLVYRLGRDVLGPSAAAAGAALVAVGYEPVVHGAQLRAYELLALVAALLAVLLLRELRSPQRWLDVALAATVWTGLLTHYFFVYSAVAALAWVWLEPRAQPVRRRVTVAFAAGAALASPWLPAFVAQYRHDHFWWIGRFSLRVVAVTPLRQFAPLGVHHVVLGVAALAVFVAGLVSLSRRSGETRLLAALAGGPLVAAAGAWAAGSRTYAIRNLIETAPFFALAAAAALDAVPRRGGVPAAVAGVAAIAAVSVAAVALPPPPFPRLARDLVAEGWRPSDPIAVVGNFFVFRAPLEWYLPHGPLFRVSRPAGRGCAAVFVIAPARGPRTALPRDVRALRRASGFIVVRLDRLPARRLPRSTILATARAPRTCVELSRDPRLAPLA